MGDKVESLKKNLQGHSAEKKVEINKNLSIGFEQLIIPNLKLIEIQLLEIM